jgi:hypothetical protein
MSEITLTQYYNNGRQKPVTTDVPSDVAEMAKDQVLSCELMPNQRSNEVVLYARHKDWNEEDELCDFAVNEPGNHAPTEKIIELIRRVHKQHKDHPDA